jgi:hypothetical protein
VDDQATIWQFASGGRGRNYGRLLIDWGVIVLGPGRFGNWNENQATYDSKLSGQKSGEIRRFYRQVEVGDRVVLRKGTDEAHAVGVIESDAVCHEAFGDVDGWDLQHTRRVRWLWTHDGSPKTFDTYTFNFGQTLTKGVDEGVAEWVRSLNLSYRTDNPLPALPESGGQDISIQDIGRHLFDAGVDSSSINELSRKIEELNRIARWYGRSKEKPSEHETVAYLVIPLMRVLGWTPQKMGVEWNRVDLALFDDVPRTKEKLVATVEAKKWGNSCLTARSQAERYARDVAGDRCQRLIVTDGNRYGVFLRNGSGGFGAEPDAYLNLAHPKDAYPILKSDGAHEALRLMSSDWRR